jgi:hypothetical protein
MRAADVHYENTLQFWHIEDFNAVWGQELTGTSAWMTARVGIELLDPAKLRHGSSPRLIGNRGTTTTATGPNTFPAWRRA